MSDRVAKAADLILTDPGLSDIIRILQPYNPQRIILFGSRARGQADELSDYDIVVVKDTDVSFLERLQEMVPYLVEFGRPAEILVYTPGELDQMQGSGLGWILSQEGVTLYEQKAN